MHAVQSQGTLRLVTEPDDLPVPRPTRHPQEAAMRLSMQKTTRIGFRTGGSLLALSGGLLRRTTLGEKNL
jgi:hypothetical protein